MSETERYDAPGPFFPSLSGLLVWSDLMSESEELLELHDPGILIYIHNDGLFIFSYSETLLPKLF